MQGRAVASDLKISPIIDHPALRSFINSIAKLKGEGACLSIITIDSVEKIVMYLWLRN